MRFPFLFWLWPLALWACASINTSRPSTDTCPQAEPSKPFSSDESLALAGKYELIMISQWEADRGKVVRGRLELWAPDSLFQHYEPSWYAYSSKPLSLRLLPKDSITKWIKSAHWKPLIGTADIDLRALSLPTENRLNSRDPFEPGVRLEGANLQLEPVRLGFLRFDGSSTSLTIERTSRDGFSGRWKESGWLVRVRDGRELPDPTGTFCARRLTRVQSAEVGASPS